MSRTIYSVFSVMGNDDKEEVQLERSFISEEKAKEYSKTQRALTTPDILYRSGFDYVRYYIEESLLED